MSKILALDYGEKRIGVAVSDEGEQFAFAKEHIPAGDHQKLLDFISENEIGEIVVGYPVSLEGKESKSTIKVQSFVTRLEKDTKIPVWKIDERLSTKEVLSELSEFGQDLKSHREMIDSFVAQKMLERYLANKKNKDV